MEPEGGAEEDRRRGGRGGSQAGSDELLPADPVRCSGWRAKPRVLPCGRAMVAVSEHGSSNETRLMNYRTALSFPRRLTLAHCRLLRDTLVDMWLQRHRGTPSMP